MAQASTRHDRLDGQALGCYEHSSLGPGPGSGGACGRIRHESRNIKRKTATDYTDTIMLDAAHGLTTAHRPHLHRGLITIIIAPSRTDPPKQLEEQSYRWRSERNFDT